MINELCKKAHANAVNKGFWEEDKSFGEQIALMHSELSEALEEYRDGRGIDSVYFQCKLPQNISCNIGQINGVCLTNISPIENQCESAKPCGIPIELADVLIRIFDTCGRYGIDLEQAIEIKMKYNESRPYKHNKVI